MSMREREGKALFDELMRHVSVISTALNEVEALLTAHRAEMHPQLVHFLEGRSYAKALLWLGGDSAFAKPASPPGGCGTKN